MFVSRIKFIRSKLPNLSAYVSGVSGRIAAAPPPPPVLRAANLGWRRTVKSFEELPKLDELWRLRRG